jgi:hypothetical protein
VTHYKQRCNNSAPALHQLPQPQAAAFALSYEHKEDNLGFFVQNKNQTVMSEKEYMEMYLTELTSAKNELYVLTLFLCLTALAFGGGDDQEDDPCEINRNRSAVPVPSAVLGAR